MGKGNGKISYQRWTEFRNAMKTIRQARSWNEASKELGKSSAGWAQAAFQHRSVVEEADVDEAIRVALQLVESGEAVSFDRHPEPKPGLHRSEDFVDAVDELIESHGATWQAMSEHERGGSIMAAWNRIKKGEQAKVTTSTRDAALAMLDAARRGEISFRAAPTAAPDTPLKEIAPQAPKEKAQDAWAWMDDVRETLFALAGRVENEGMAVPEAFRGPFNAKAEALLEFANREFGR
jgi:hypothetical protein